MLVMVEAETPIPALPVRGKEGVRVGESCSVQPRSSLTQQASRS